MTYARDYDCANLPPLSHHVMIPTEGLPDCTSNSTVLRVIGDGCMTGRRQRIVMSERSPSSSLRTKTIRIISKTNTVGNNRELKLKSSLESVRPLGWSLGLGGSFAGFCASAQNCRRQGGFAAPGHCRQRTPSGSKTPPPIATFIDLTTANCNLHRPNHP